MTCPRRYEYEIKRGMKLAGPGVHTAWGSGIHNALEVFDRARLEGRSVDLALYDAVDFALKSTGQYVTIKPNDTFPEGATVWTPWDSEDDKKSLHTLIRAIVWFADEQRNESSVQPYAFTDGTPATEISFRIPLPLKAREPGTPNFLLCGHIDSMCTYGDELFGRERKSTATTIGSYYWKRYSPNVQIDTYDLALWLMFPNLKISGVMMEGIQTAVNFARFVRQPLYHTKARREEWLARMLDVIQEAEACARAQTWPMNTAACNLNGGCPYQRICSADPSQRERLLTETGDYVERKWDPLKVR